MKAGWGPVKKENLNQGLAWNLHVALAWLDGQAWIS